MKKHIRFTSVFLVVSLLVACAAPTTGPIGEIPVRVNTARDDAQKAFAALRQKEASGLVTHSKESWLPLKKVDRVAMGAPRYKADTTDFDTNEPFRNLSHVVNEISSRTGIPVAIAPDVPMYPQLTPGVGGVGGIGGIGGAMAPAPMPLGVPGGAMPGQPSQFGQAGGNYQSAQITGASPYRSQYSGKLTGFMDVVANYYGVSWRAEKNTLRFFYLDSQTFRIKALPGNTKLSSTVGSSSGASGASNATGSTGSQSGTSANSTGVTFDALSVWDGLNASIAPQLTPNVGKVFVSPATGTVTVKDTPAVLSRIARFIDDQNESLARQVAVNVRVLSVELKDTDEYGINWNAVYTSLADSAGISLRTAFPASQGAANMVFSVVDPSGASRWTGSQAMINALSTQGRVSELTSATLVTTNNQAAPVNVGRRVSYLASSATTSTPNVGATTTLTPGTVDTGFSMTLVPHILDAEELMLQYSMDLSSLLNMNVINSGNSSIQAPDISTSNFIQRIRMNSGETLVVAGFDQNNLSAVSQGVGSAQNNFMGNRNGSNKRTMLVVLIQPILSPQPVVAAVN